MRGLALHAAFALALPAHASADLPTRASSQSGVTVKVTPRSLAGTAWEFEVAFDTHTQPLTDDLLKGAELVAAPGRTAAPLGWQGDPPGGHHRKGVLRFAAPSPRPASFELRLSRPGETQVRAFRWQLD